MREKQLQYIKNIIKLESDFYLMSNFIPKMNRAKDALCDSCEPDYPERLPLKECVEMVGTGGLLIGIAIGVIGTLFTADGLLDIIIGGIFGSMGLAIIGGIAGLCLSPVVCFSVNMYRKSRYNREKEAAYPQMVKAKKQCQVIDYYVKEIHLSWLTDNRDILSKYYKKGNIPAECQNLKAMNVVLQCFTSHNSTSLAEAVRYGCAKSDSPTREYNNTVFLQDKMIERLVSDLISESAAENFKIENSKTYQYISNLVKEEQTAQKWLESVTL